MLHKMSVWHTKIKCSIFCVKHVANVIHCIESDMFIIFQGCMLLRLSICGTLDLMGFHRIAFGPSPQQNHLVGRGD